MLCSYNYCSTNNNLFVTIIPYTTTTVPGLYERNTCLHPTDAEFAKGLQCCLSLGYFGCLPYNNN